MAQMTQTLLFLLKFTIFLINIIFYLLYDHRTISRDLKNFSDIYNFFQLNNSFTREHFPQTPHTPHSRIPTLVFSQILKFEAFYEGFAGGESMCLAADGGQGRGLQKGGLHQGKRIQQQKEGQGHRPLSKDVLRLKYQYQFTQCHPDK